MSTESELRDWRNGQTNAERMCAAILAIEGYTDIDPQAPLGGPDDKKDILARRSGHRFVVAVFFPSTHQNFASIKRKFTEDRSGVARHQADGFVFMVNQPLTLGERQQLEDLGGPLDELYHLERLRRALDSPSGYGLRLEYLRRSMTVEEQIAFFSTLNPDLTERFLAKDRQRGNASDPAPGDDVVHQAAIGAANQPLPTSDYGEALGDIAAPMSRFSISTLLLLHRAVTAGSTMPSSLRGQLRTVTVWISDGSSKPLYIPPAADQVPEQLTEALQWWRSTYPTLVGAPEEDVLHGLAKLCHEFLMIHPFLDGNKRLAVAIVDQAAIELLGRGVGAELFEAAAYLRTYETPRGGNLEELAKLIRAALV